MQSITHNQVTRLKTVSRLESRVSFYGTEHRKQGTVCLSSRSACFYRQLNRHGVTSISRFKRPLSLLLLSFLDKESGRFAKKSVFLRNTGFWARLFHIRKACYYKTIMNESSFMMPIVRIPSNNREAKLEVLVTPFFSIFSTFKYVSIYNQ